MHLHYLLSLSSVVFALNVVGGSVVLPVQISLQSAHGPSVAKATKVALLETFGFVAAACLVTLCWIFLDEKLSLNLLSSVAQANSVNLNQKTLLIFISLTAVTVLVIYRYRAILKNLGSSLAAKLQKLEFSQWQETSLKISKLNYFVVAIVLPLPWILEGCLLGLLVHNYSSQPLSLISAIGIVSFSYIVGLVSMIPGAWGSRDVTIAALLAAFGLPISEALVVIVAMRFLKSSISIVYSIVAGGIFWKLLR